MFSWLRDNLFYDNFGVDTREPAWVLPLPDFVSSLILADDSATSSSSLSLGIIPTTLAFDVVFLMQFVIVCVLHNCMASGFSLFVYRFVLPYRRNSPATAWLVGYGVAIPALLIFPYYVLTLLGIENTALSINIVGTPVMIAPRILEVMHGTPPACSGVTAEDPGQEQRQGKNFSTKTKTTASQLGRQESVASASTCSTAAPSTAPGSSLHDDSSTSSDSSKGGSQDEDVDDVPSKTTANGRAGNSTITSLSNPEHGDEKEQSAKLDKFMSYLSSPVQFELDENGMNRKLRPTELQGKMKRWIVSAATTSLLFSALSPFDYAPFPSKNPRTSLTDYFYWGNMLNGYLAAYLICSAIQSTSMLATMAMCSQTGHSVFDPMDDPLTRSTSPSEFWSKRWNRPVTWGLRRGVYKPLLQADVCGPAAASIATFFVSGILHEYMLFMFSCGKQSYSREGGNHALFFVWCGFLLLAERLIRRYCPSTIDFVGKHVPQPLQTAVLLVTVIPVTHWFTDEVISMGLFTDLSMSFPKFVLLHQ